MLKVEVYARVRRAVQVDGMSIRQASREFGLARKTIRKMLAYSVPPGYERKKPVKRPKLGPWLGIIDQILEEDKSQPKKQRHTAKRMWDRLKAEHGFRGGYTVVKDYVRGARLQHKEVFVPLVHPPGDAQVDFGEALVVVGGEEQKAHFLCMDLPQSDDCFVMVSGGEHGVVPGGPQPGICLLRGSSTDHPVRQHQNRGEGDLGRRGTQTDPGI